MNKPKFIYTDLDDPKYIKDKNELLREHGNGWWWGEWKDITIKIRLKRN